MEQPPPYSPEGYHPPQQRYQGYEPLPNTNYPPQSTPYPPQQQTGYPPQKQYEGGYQNQGYPPQNPDYPHQNPGYPSQGQGYIQQPAGFSTQTNSTTTVVVQNQPQLPTGVNPVVNDRMTLSIVVCVCCCWPIGIFAILKSSEARNRYMAGDYAGAVASARRARNLAYAALVCGFILKSLYIALIVAAKTSSDYN